MADEIYDRVLYDDAVHVPMCTLAKNCLVISHNGLSKSHRIAGFRSGWMMLSGKNTMRLILLKVNHAIINAAVCQRALTIRDSNGDGWLSKYASLDHQPVACISSATSLSSA